MAKKNNKDKDDSKVGGKGSTSTKGIMKQIKKEIEILDKEMIEFENDKKLFSEFVQRIDNWYNSTYIQQMYGHMYSSLGRYISYSNFIAGLIDLNAPCNELERHTLARLLDPSKRDNIPYNEIQELLWSRYGEKNTDLTLNETKSKHYRSSLIMSVYSETNLLAPHIQVKKKQLPLNCGLYEPRWLLVFIKMIKFDRFPQHPGNLEMMFTDDTCFEIVILQIQKVTELPTYRFGLYSSPNISPETKIDLELTFKDLGIIGGPKFSPEETVMYYDFDIGYIDDSLVMKSQF